MRNQILFFTCCTEKYKQFIIPYIYFANKFNQNSSFEIVVDQVTNNLIDGIQYLKQTFNIPILIYQRQQNIQGQFLRFLIEPKTNCEYTYIGDIDILILENILSFHLEKLNIYKTIFDNQIRLTNTSRLTGLHFVKKEYFNLVKQSQNQYIQKILNFKNDEQYKYINDQGMLFDICKKSNLKFPPLAISNQKLGLNRPVHGIHFSLNRRPFKSDSKFKLKTSIYYKNELVKIINSNQYKIVSTYFDKLFLQNLNKLLKFFEI